VDRYRLYMGHIARAFATLLGFVTAAVTAVVITGIAAGSVYAATSSSSSSGSSVTSSSANSPSTNASGSADLTKPKPLDGVILEAVETYAEPKTNEIGLGIGIYPFDAYYYGVSINAAYTYHINRNFAWEVVNAQYFFGFQKDLTTELAQVYNVAPSTIPQLSYIVSTDGAYAFSYGKSVLFEDFIRYFRDSALFGLGVVKRTDINSASINVGLKFEMFTTENFSWKFETRDNFAFSGSNNYLTFIIGTGLSF
jgi:outer membrane beta-barrel protein